MNCSASLVCGAAMVSAGISALCPPLTCLLFRRVVACCRPVAWVTQPYASTTLHVRAPLRGGAPDCATKAVAGAYVARPRCPSHGSAMHDDGYRSTADAWPLVQVASLQPRTTRSVTGRHQAHAMHSRADLCLVPCSGQCRRARDTTGTFAWPGALRVAGGPANNLNGDAYPIQFQ